MYLTLARSIIIYIWVMISIRIMGKRQLSQINSHELVITILISSIATAPIEDNKVPLSLSLVPIGIFVALEMLASVISVKSKWIRQKIQGKAIVVVRNGKIDQKALEEIRFCEDDLIAGLRLKDAFDINEVELAMVEANGELSVKLKSDKSGEEK